MVLESMKLACDSYTWALNGLTHNTSTNDTVVLTTTNGCDSTVILNLTINSSFVSPSQPINILACDSFINPFDGQVITISGIYTLSIGTTLDGCDSLFAHNIL